MLKAVIKKEVEDPLEAKEEEELQNSMELEDVETRDGDVDEEEEEDGDDEDYEELTMVVTVNGILDADLVREAVQRDNIKLRYAETDAPVLQINNSLYTGTWNQDLGTNMIMQSKGKDLEVISCTSTMLTVEKALLTSVSAEGSSIAATADSAPRAALSRTQARGK